MKKNKYIVFGDAWISISDVMQIANSNTAVKLSDKPKFKNKINQGVKLLKDTLKKDGVIYGVTTGVGDSCERSVPSHLVSQLSINLARFHGCGLGRYFSHNQSRAIIAVRLCSLAKGFSGVTLPLLEQIIKYNFIAICLLL